MKCKTKKNIRINTEWTHAIQPVRLRSMYVCLLNIRELCTDTVELKKQGPQQQQQQYSGGTRLNVLSINITRWCMYKHRRSLYITSTCDTIKNDFERMHLWNLYVLAISIVSSFMHCSFWRRNKIHVQVSVRFRCTFWSIQ